MLYGMIDIGSNTVRMAIYFIEGTHVEMLMKKKHTVGLAAYLKDGVMQQQGIDKTVEILTEFKSFLMNFNITHVVAFTTAALRNAKNSKAAVGEIERRTGLPIRVITGDEEATYDFIGATHGLTAEGGLLIDIGGASTEIVVYRGREIQEKVSLPIGSLAFYTKYVAGILPTAEECQAMREEARATLAAAEGFEDVKEGAIAGIGGTFKGACALYNALFHESADNVKMEAAKLSEIIRRFTFEHTLTEETTVMLMRTVPERMHTVIPGLIIAEVLASRFHSQSITYSDSGVREGYIYAEVLGR
ncbi:Ppx/GppA phosphatase family protein [Mitsuokella jalaludinii]|uniref:Ppx/GppA phosphatase family protein n=1 Tax=Mitsuokella jalaludinii TaxID=187979 RepID=UPI003F9C815E